MGEKRHPPLLRNSVKYTQKTIFPINFKSGDVSTKIF